MKKRLHVFFLSVGMVFFSLGSFLGLSAEPVKRSDVDYLRLAERTYNTGHFDQSKTFLYEGLEAFSLSYLRPEFILLLAACYQKLGERDQAEVLLRGLKGMFPSTETDENALILQSSIEMDRGNFERAAYPLLNLKSARALYQSALLLEKTGQSFAAVSRLIELKNSFPRDPLQQPAGLALANSYFSLREFNLVRGALGTSPEVQADEDQTARSYLMAATLFEKGHYKDVLNALRQIPIRQDQWAPYVLTLKGVAALRSDLPDVAESAFRPNIQSDNSLCRLRSAIELSGYYIRQHQFDRAVETCATAINAIDDRNEKLPFLLVRGFAYEKKGQSSQALKDFEHVISANHDQWTPKAFVFSGLILRRQNNFERLITDYAHRLSQYREFRSRQAKEESSNGDLAWSELLVADAQYTLQHYKRAEGLYQDILNTSPPASLSAQVVSGLVASLMLQKKYKKAEQRIDELLVRFGEDREVIRFTLLSKAHLNWNRNDFAEAAKAYQRFAEMFPRDANTPVAFYFLGRCRESLHAGKKALDVWSLLRENFPDNPYAFKSLIRSASLAKSLGKDQVSRALYLEIAQKGKTQAAELALLQLGSMARNANRNFDAVQIYDRFLREYPTSAHGSTVTTYLQHLYEKIGQIHPDRLEALAQQYKGSSHAGEAWFNLGKRALAAKEYKKAHSYFETVVQTYSQAPSASWALFYKGQCDYVLGNYAKSVVSLRHFVKEHRDDDLSFEAEYYQGQALMKIDRLPLAIEVFKHLVGRDPHSYFTGNALLRSGEAYNVMNNPEEEIRAYEKFVHDFSHREEVNKIYLQLASIKKRLGRYEAALNDLERVKPEAGLISEGNLKSIRGNLSGLLAKEEAIN